MHVNEPSGYYENDTTLAQYLEFHFGESWHGEPNFPQELARLCFDAMNGRDHGKALDLGCACGRATFELATRFDHVDGVDFSESFVSSAAEMAKQKQMRYARPEEGELVSYQERTLASLGLEDTVGRVAFHQGDACDLNPRFTGYDLVLAANLIDRLYQPSKFLTTIHERITDNGLLVIASPYTWLEEYTPREAWVGGFRKDGEDYTTLDGLQDMLAPHFRLLVDPHSVPFVIRETRNKFQHSFSEVTVWEKL
ncbi:putative 4-mercaptohistidine N1-methyltransferase [Marinobacter pelagius]|uniref:Putative 4-mercaptohistidine N1-methyltranferase n=1 Tax=Marinobacter pelagius TaxID=379482 RepID=A0A1I4QUJ1_9GAMM|nr:putative 4-mercaptohistidine N1-methyltransferase [Marinobacter pelagius]SFM43752.1 putative 4-mercaptohistidine N1-methyltranferase [Marinobacter pelagius]